jgi:hypothetical protein
MIFLGFPRSARGLPVCEHDLWFGQALAFATLTTPTWGSEVLLLKLWELWDVWRIVLLGVALPAKGFEVFHLRILPPTAVMGMVDVKKPALTVFLAARVDLELGVTQIGPQH